jgi:hypothetical protein
MKRETAQSRGVIMNDCRASSVMATPPLTMGRYEDRGETQTCKTCGATFVKKAPQQKYCQGCSKSVHYTGRAA